MQTWSGLAPHFIISHAIVLWIFFSSPKKTIYVFYFLLWDEVYGERKWSEGRREKAISCKVHEYSKEGEVNVIRENLYNVCMDEFRVDWESLLSE